MLYIFFLIFAIIKLEWVYGYSQSSSIFKNYNLVVPNTETSKMEYKCSNECESGVDVTVMIRTTVNNRTTLNTLNEGYAALVYYRCSTSPSRPYPQAWEYHLFQRLCGNKVYLCKECQRSYDEEWYSVNKRVLRVDLHLPFNSNEVMIKTIKCLEEPTVFVFKVDNNSIVYKSNSAYKYDKGDFYTNRLDKSPIQLSISKHPRRDSVDVLFNITKSKCTDSLHEQYDNAEGYKCFIKTQQGKVEAGYPSVLCPGPSDTDQSASKNVSKDWCQNNSEDKNSMCEDLCYNMKSCSYLCVKKEDDELVEGGYKMNLSMDQYPDVIGSGGWKKTKVPLNLVSFNECLFVSNLCDLGSEYCMDTFEGFSCSKGNYSLKRCLDLRFQSPYWQCPADEAAIGLALQTPGLLKNKTDAIFYQKQIKRRMRNMKLDTIKRLQLAFTILSKNLANTNTNTLLNLSLKEKREFSSFLLKKFVSNFSTYLKKEKPSIDGLPYYYSEDIEADKEEIDIPMFPNNAKNNTQYIKLQLQRSKTESNQTVRANYFQFQTMDIMDETGSIRSNRNKIKLIKNVNISQEDYSDEEETENAELYKNSVMFSLLLNDTNFIKSVKFRLDIIEKVEFSSWLYEVKDVCGFLDKKKDWTWSVKGCWMVSNVSLPYCECNHLSNFAMLFSLKKVNESHLRAFEILSAIAAVINVVSLLLFLIFILLINSREKLRIDQLNIAICLLLGTILFMSGSFLDKNNVICSLSALASQFLLLSAFMWKLILGINVVRMIASLRYQNEDWMVKYRWIILIAGYSIPLVIVILSGSIYWKDYGQISDKVCWIDASSKAFLSFLIPVGVIIAVNTIGLFFIANTLIRNYINTRKTRMNESNELIVFVQLLVSMGLTWIPSYFATAYLCAMYIFVLFFPLQGLLMFLLVVVFNKENREKVSSFILNSYLTITSKSTTGSEGKIISKSKSTGQSKATGENENLLSSRDKSQEKDEKLDGKVLVGEDSVPDHSVSNC